MTGKATVQYYWMTIRTIEFADCTLMIWIIWLFHFFDSMQRTKRGSHIEEKIAISRVNGIYDYKGKLLKTVEDYLKKNK